MSWLKVVKLDSLIVHVGADHFPVFHDHGLAESTLVKFPIKKLRLLVRLPFEGGKKGNTVKILGQGRSR